MNLRSRNKVSPDFSMSSMTDIVFLLLVFFLLTSPSITPQALDLILPSASGRSENKQQASVSITKDGAFFVDAVEVEEERLESMIIKTMEGQEKPTIILRADGDIALNKAVKVMDIANRNKINIILAVKPE
ncbi:biopolymer transporter ExbD [Nonlabens arenilitoris]|uniref:Biopolymer transporter ExbD n=1 Tax=Nonlabens arenilitoris TaxID=1217969 RepID=A0A2S7U9R5_9FLAO|nr:biopolymer transporter ExbD [Nonlabens arenilitoris]PQJ31013.1 biopolymer transporter ExbD [Nonlabens arenilitoris]